MQTSLRSYSTFGLFAFALLGCGSRINTVCPDVAGNWYSDETEHSISITQTACTHLTTRETIGRTQVELGLKIEGGRHDFEGTVGEKISKSGAKAHYQASSDAKAIRVNMTASKDGKENSSTLEFHLESPDVLRVDVSENSKSRSTRYRRLKDGEKIESGQPSKLDQAIEKLEREHQKLQEQLREATQPKAEGTPEVTSEKTQ